MLAGNTARSFDRQTPRHSHDFRHSVIDHGTDQIAEPGAMKDDLRRLHELAALGELSGEIAHEFGNILQIIVGSALFMANSSSGWSKHDSDYQRIVDAAERGARLVKQLLSAQRHHKTEFIRLDLRTLLQNLAALLRPLLRERIGIQILPEEGAPVVFGDTGSLEQVVLNLCLNARDAMPDGGTITLGYRTVSIDESACLRNQAWLPGRYVVMSVADTGQGIPESIREHIFEPRFTTKAAGKGTGLGLAIVADIVKRHCGFVDVISEVGRGTRIDVYLPQPE